MFEGFEIREIEVSTARIHLRVAGDGPPLLLLHGYPQTHAMWHAVAPELALTHRVVAADLRGYGASRARDGDFTFRAMARDMVEVMGALGAEAFDVIAHDRGARAAHRMALDTPGAVRTLALLDILPTLDVWRTMDDWLARRYWHWTFLAQRTGMPERMICADPVAFLHDTLRGLSGALGTFHPDALAAYEAAARQPETVAAWCADYAAGADEDVAMDRADCGATRDTPCLILWGRKGVVGHHLDPVEAWRAWFPQATGASIDAGHFLVEEAHAATLSALQAHLDTHA
ncbi:MAG: alpha/beta hydrolase [Pseudomonadota bacterium]